MTIAAKIFERRVDGLKRQSGPSASRRILIDRLVGPRPAVGTELNECDIRDVGQVALPSNERVPAGKATFGVQAREVMRRCWHIGRLVAAIHSRQ